jgi:hypothetical protein
MCVTWIGSDQTNAGSGNRKSGAAARSNARLFCERRPLRGSYDDGNGGHCLVGALLHLSRKHRLPTGSAIALLQDAMPRPGLPLVHFNDTRCGSIAELRSLIVKARRLARDDAERERAAAAVKSWLLARIEKKRAAPASDMVEAASSEQFAPERLAA